jgi:hypothetical protein
MGSKMLSAAGARNIRAVKKREKPAQNTIDDRVGREDEELTVNHSNMSNAQLLNSKRRSRTSGLLPSASARRIRGGIGEMKDKSRSSVEAIKEKSRSGVDTIKKKGRSGVDLMRETGSSIVAKTPSVRVLKKKDTSALPSRSLFQHKPRTWFGGKVDKGDKVKEDWRNSRPPPNSFKRSPTLESIKQ